MLYFCKCFRICYIIRLLYNNSEVSIIIIILILEMRKLKLEDISSLLKDTQIISSRVRIGTQASSYQNAMIFSLYPL